jgi:DNA polymerase-3 subunit delta
VSKAKFVDWRKVQPSPLILIFGSEEYLYTATIRRLKDQVRANDSGVYVIELEASEYVAGDLENMVSPSLFSEPKLVIITGVERCSDALIEDGKALRIESLVDATVVFQHAGTSTRGKALLDAIRANPDAVEIACAKIAKDPEKVAFVQSHFNEAGRKFTQTAVKHLVEAVGSNILELAAACDQLLVDSAEQIDEELVNRYFGGRIEADAYKILNAALKGNSGEALMMLRHSLQTGHDLIFLLGAFARKVRDMCQISSDPRATAASLGMNPYGFSETKKVVAGWDDDGLARALQAVVLADAAAKGAERQPEYRMEQLILLISNRGRE